MFQTQCYIPWESRAKYSPEYQRRMNTGHRQLHEEFEGRQKKRLKVCSGECSWWRWVTMGQIEGGGCVHCLRTSTKQRQKLFFVITHRESFQDDKGSGFSSGLLTRGYVALTN